MLFDGEPIKAEELGEGLVELRFARKAGAENKLDRLAFSELGCALEIIAKAPGVTGALVTSAKDAFIVGADIFEFVDLFAGEDKDIVDFFVGNARIVTALSDLPVPTVAAI